MDAETRRTRYRFHKCRCCGEWFRPEPHNAWHQRYCSDAACRRASHRRSQRKCRRRVQRVERLYCASRCPRPARNTVDVTRVRLWRRAHPRYWRSAIKRDRLQIRVLIFRKPLGRLRIRMQMERLKTGALWCPVKELLGHESLATLKHYARLTIVDLKLTHARCHPRERDGDRPGRQQDGGSPCDSGA